MSGGKVYENSAKCPSTEFKHHEEYRTEDADGSDEGGDVGELGNSRSDDERECPVDDDRYREQVLSSLDCQRRGTENLNQNVLIDDFNANVPVQRSSNETGDKTDDIRRCL